MRNYLTIDMLTKAQITKIKVETAERNGQFPLVFEALGDQGRFRIFRLLMRYHDICVTDVAKILEITTSAASQQLKVLERVGLVQKVRMGQMVCYEIKGDPVAQKIAHLLKVEKSN